MGQINESPRRDRKQRRNTHLGLGVLLKGQNRLRYGCHTALLVTAMNIVVVVVAGR